MLLGRVIGRVVPCVVTPERVLPTTATAGCPDRAMSTLLCGPIPPTVAPNTSFSRPASNAVRIYMELMSAGLK